MSVAPVPPPARPRLARRVLRWTLPVLLLGVAAGVWQRERLWVWYCAERLERAADDRRGEWADKLAAVGEPAVPTLLDLLRGDDPGVCLAARGGLDHLIADWPKDDPRRLAVARRFVDAEPRFSTPGRSAALDLLPAILACGDEDVARKAKGMIATAAKSESVDLRIQAVATALRPEVDALDAIVPLLSDPEADVRRAAVLALGPIRDGAIAVVTDEELLHCLHDADPEVRRLCEMGLRSRGRTPRDIFLGRRYTAPDPAERQKLLLDLADEEGLDVTVWLERLTNDPDPAVRAGAARVAVERRADLRDRLEQMSRSDPDGTVRRIADYYRRKLVASR
jgi:HEAT repeat protein